MSTATMERFSAKKDFHLSVLGTMVHKNALIELHRSNQVMRINGSVMGTGDQGAVQEAIRVVTTLADTPEAQLVEKLPKVDNSRPPKTQTITAFPIIGCLVAAEEFLSSKLDWGTINDEQLEFMELFFNQGVGGIGEFTKDELKWIANQDVGKVNSWIREHGFDVQLGENSDPGGFSVASILNILVEWMKEGQVRPIHNDKGRFDGVFLNKGIRVMQNPHVHDHPVVRIKTKTEDRVYMTPIDGLPDERFALESKIRSIMVGLEHEDHRYEGVVFPMVEYDQEIDLSFLRGLQARKADGDSFFVSQAIQQTKFRMNQKGARVESVAAMSMKRSISRVTPPFIIDRPFMFWIMRESVGMPLFGGIFAEDVWKNPGE